MYGLTEDEMRAIDAIIQCNECQWKLKNCHFSNDIRTVFVEANTKNIPGKSQLHSLNRFSLCVCVGGGGISIFFAS